MCLLHNAWVWHHKSNIKYNSNFAMLGCDEFRSDVWYFISHSTISVLNSFLILPKTGEIKILLRNGVLG